MGHISTILSILIFCRSPDRKKKPKKMKMIVAFVLFCAVASTQALTWKSCGGDVVKVTFPGEIEAELDAEVMENLASPIKVEMSLKKAGLTLPCIPVGDKMLGSCTYNDICETLKKIPDDCKGAGILGDIIADAGLPCRCPLPANKVVVSGVKAVLPKVPSFIAFLAEGEINIQAKASDASGRLLGCVELTVNAHFEL